MNLIDKQIQNEQMLIDSGYLDQINDRFYICFMLDGKLYSVAEEYPVIKNGFMNFNHYKTLFDKPFQFYKKGQCAATNNPQVYHAYYLAFNTYMLYTDNENLVCEICEDLKQYTN